MKKPFNIILVLLLILTVFSCKKDKEIDNTDDNLPVNTDNYSSIDNFFAANASPMQIYHIDGASGGDFTTPNGTQVSIPTYAFVTQTGLAVIGDVTIYFKDIFVKG